MRVNVCVHACPYLHACVFFSPLCPPPHPHRPKPSTHHKSCPPSHPHFPNNSVHIIPPLTPPQVRALQLWTLANRNGQFRIYANNRQEARTLQYSTIVLTTGAAIVTVLRWLAELR